MKKMKIARGVLLVAAALFLLSAQSVLAQDFCEGNFDYNQTVDGLDAAVFKSNYGRSGINNPCPSDGPAPVPKTGQVYSTVTGDDGFLQKGVAWPTPRFTTIYYDANFELCPSQTADCDADPETDLVTDHLTGLMWTRRADPLSPNQLPLDTAINAIGFANGFAPWGYTDWRIPNIRELESLFNYNGSAGFTLFLPDPMPFVNVPCSGGGDEFWTTTRWVTFAPPAAFTIDFCLGAINRRDITESHYFWAVRGGR